MHPDRRRAGRAIRKQRRLARTPGPLANAIASLKNMGVVSAAAAAAMLGFGRMYTAMIRMEEAHARLDAIVNAYAFHPATIERHDMTTVSITTSSTAPRDLIDHLVSYAQELESEGITVDVALIRTCIACNCTDDEACIGGCSWISEVDDLCTACDTPANRQLLDERATERAARIDALIASITDTEPLTKTNGAWS